MADPEVLNLLLEMGFSKPKAEKALRESGNNGIEVAMEWLMNHEDDTGETLLNRESDMGEASTNAGHNTPSATPSNEPHEEAKSIKCNECNKLFKSTDEVEYHAIKSGHSDFSESTEEKKPLTEEEKKEQLRLLEEKMKIKRAEREQREKAEELEKEKKRIQSGKELSAMKEKMRDDEAKKLVADRKREKAEEEAARARVRAQIEADKAARKAKMEGATTVAAAPAKAAPVAASSAPKTYTEARLQIRLPNGQALTQTFSCKEPLSAVRLYIDMNRTDGISGTFTLMTNFPKKIFNSEDYEKPLEHLGLAPSAVLIVSKAL